MIVFLPMVMDEHGENQNQWIHLESLYRMEIRWEVSFVLDFFSRDLAIAIHNEECLYHEAQQQQPIQGATNQVPRSPSKQPKKSKNKSRRSSQDDEEKSSCNLS